MQINWQQFKSLIQSKGLSLQYIESGNLYILCASDGPIILESSLHKNSEDTDTVDFETNFKDSANQLTKQEVETQFEKPDKTIKLASVKASVDENGEAIALLKAPGTPGSGDGRYVSEGTGWFDSKHPDDKVIELEVVDVDNILGYGANTVLKHWCDDEAGNNEGWYIPYHTGVAHVDTLGGYAFLPAGLYLRIVAKKGGDITTGAFYLNIKWGKLA